MSLEEKIELLVSKRKDLNNSSSFKEISEIWSEIKEGYELCKKEIKAIIEKLDSFNSTDEAQEISLNNENFDFDKSFNEMKLIAESVKGCSASEFIEKLSLMDKLKKECLLYLSANKAKIEEVQ